MFLGSLLRVALGATLFASSAFAVCCSYNRVRNAGYILHQYEDESLNFLPLANDESIQILFLEELPYSNEMMTVSTPNASSGYIASTSALVGRSVYQHPISYVMREPGEYNLTGSIISVYVFANSSEWYSVQEANLVELANGANEREIKSGFTNVYTNPNYFGEVNYANGDKEVYFTIPDLSNSTKRVKVVTCPNSVYTPANNSGILCTTTFAFIKGTANE
ncbi:MAG: hypothetical protein LBP89_10215 [Helicobacteraceae bacterium]|jgi:hypothetical protein|nr:hypothetical protein [Helicobacteraceae bacterium]